MKRTEAQKDHSVQHQRHWNHSSNRMNRWKDKKGALFFAFSWKSSLFGPYIFAFRICDSREILLSIFSQHRYGRRQLIVLCVHCVHCSSSKQHFRKWMRSEALIDITIPFRISSRLPLCGCVRVLYIFHIINNIFSGCN